MTALPTTEARVFVRFDSEEDKFLPEGPRIVPAGPGGHRGPLFWVNIQTAPDATRGNIHARIWSSPGVTTTPQPSRPGFLLPTDDMLRLIVGRGKELGILSYTTGHWQPLATIPDPNPRTIINDAEIVPGGKAIVFGTKDTKFADTIANLYLFTVDDNRVSLLVDRQLCSNGKVFASDDRGLILFDIDTPTKKVTRYRLDVTTRTATPDGVAIDTAGIPGFPDGMCDCGDGSVIIAFYNPEPVAAGKAIRFDLATGRAVGEWTTPGSPRVTCPCLVSRPDGVKLVLTTATEGMPADQRARCPDAGNLFIADTGFASCPVPEVVRLSG
jgi:sugar lactone lactonase YvrE